MEKRTQKTVPRVYLQQIIEDIKNELKKGKKGAFGFTANEVCIKNGHLSAFNSMGRYAELKWGHKPGCTVLSNIVDEVKRIE